MVKLSSDEQAILAMKSMYANGSNYREICELFEITPPTLYQHVKEERSRQREKYERTKREFVEFLNSKLGFRGAVSWLAKIVEPLDKIFLKLKKENISLGNI
jgi:hypothetical protein